MNHRVGLILSFKYISELQKGDVFSLDHNGKDTAYYTFEGIKDGSFCALSKTDNTQKLWSSDFRIIEIKKIDRILQ